MNTTSGRGRINVHAALNLENFDTPLIAPDTVNGTSAAQLLAKIEARNRRKRTVFYAPSPDPKSGAHFSDQVMEDCRPAKNRYNTECNGER